MIQNTIILSITAFARHIGQTWYFFFCLTCLLLQGKINVGRTVQCIADILTRSLHVALLASICLGGSLVLQFFHLLSKYQAVHLIGGLSSCSLIAEIAPFITAFVLAGKIGAYTTAELATMKATQQMDAIESLGTSVLSYLIAPRWLGIFWASFLLSIISLSIAATSSIICIKWYAGISELEFLSTLPRFLSLKNYLFAIFKIGLFSMISATVACSYGYHASSSAQGVGEAVTYTAVYTNIYMMVTNYLASEWVRIWTEIL